MKIVSNEEFKKYDVTEESWNNGRNLSLDGECLISAGVLMELRQSVSMISDSMPIKDGDDVIGVMYKNGKDYKHDVLKLIDAKIKECTE